MAIGEATAVTAPEKVKFSGDVAEAYAFCSKMAQKHYENFPVGSWLIPRRLRPHVHVVYAFARIADDFADEAHYDGQRFENLDDWEQQLEDCYAGRFKHPVYVALDRTRREFDIPIQLLKDLIDAFKQDVTKQRYANFDEVLDYCRRSANPVGRLVLILFRYRDEELFALSDQICSALQLANFWQDVSIDLKKDRIYIPQDDQERFGVAEQDLFDHKVTDNFRRLLKFQVERTWEIFERGKPLPGRVKSPLNFELRATWLGGTCILRMIEEADYDVFNRRPKLTKREWIRLVPRVISTRAFEAS